MAKLKWDEIGKRYYEAGTSKGVLFVLNPTTKKYDKGVAWDGLTAVKQSPDGADTNDMYANNGKYGTLRGAENFKGSIEAYTYPEEFAECDGSKQVIPGVYLGQQNRKQFALVYSTKIGNDTNGLDEGEKIHIIYGCTCSPSSREYETINNDPEPIKLTWEFQATAQSVTKEGFSSCAYVSIDSRKIETQKLEKIQKKIYGGDAPTENSSLPDINELIELIK